MFPDPTCLVLAKEGAEPRRAASPCSSLGRRRVGQCVLWPRRPIPAFGGVRGGCASPSRNATRGILCLRCAPQCAHGGPQPQGPRCVRWGLTALPREGWRRRGLGEGRCGQGGGAGWWVLLDLQDRARGHLGWVRCRALLTCTQLVTDARIASQHCQTPHYPQSFKRGACEGARHLPPSSNSLPEADLASPQGQTPSQRDGAQHRALRVHPPAGEMPGCRDSGGAHRGPVRHRLSSGCLSGTAHTATEGAPGKEVPLEARPG